MDGKKLRDLARVDLEIGAIEEKLKEKKKERKEAEAAIKKDFERDGIKKVTLADDRTIYLRKDLFVSRGKGITADDFHGALKKIGLQDFIQDTVPAARLKSHIKELKDHKAEIPKELEALLNIHEEYKVIILQKGATLDGDTEEN